jgi:hypothetical protein
VQYGRVNTEEGFEMSISDGLMHVADLRLAAVNGTPGIGFARLQFSLEIDIRGTPGRTVELGNLAVFVYAGTSQSGSLKPLGTAVAEQAGSRALRMTRDANS